MAIILKLTLGESSSRTLCESEDAVISDRVSGVGWMVATACLLLVVVWLAMRQILIAPRLRLSKSLCYARYIDGEAHTELCELG